MDFTFGEPNVPKASFEEYIHLWRGQPKAGKTTLFGDVMTEEFGDFSNGVLLSLGLEKGHTAISGIRAQHCEDWVQLRAVAKELIKNKAKHGFKVVAFDTIDELTALAKNEVLEEHKRQNNGYAAKSYKGALGGFSAPGDHKEKVIKEMISSFQKAGYGIVFIGHTKATSVPEMVDGVLTGESYPRLVSNLSHKDAEVFTNMSDVIATIYTERTVQGNKYKKTSSTSGQRYIYFRDNDYVEAGSRFPKMVERVKWEGNGANSYLTAFRDGVINSAKITEEEIEAKKLLESKTRQEKSANYIGGANRDDVLELMKELYNDKQDEIKSLMSQYGASKFDEVETKDLPSLKADLQKLKE